MEQKEQFEEIPTVRPGDKVLRWQRRHRGLRHAISRKLAGLRRHKSGKYEGIR